MTIMKKQPSFQSWKHPSISQRIKKTQKNKCKEQGNKESILGAFTQNVCNLGCFIACTLPVANTQV